MKAMRGGKADSVRPDVITTRLSDKWKMHSIIAPNHLRKAKPFVSFAYLHRQTGSAFR